MKLQELLKERERIDKELEKYNVEMRKRRELYSWRTIIETSINSPIPVSHRGQINMYIPDHIRYVFLNALQAEIDKIEKG